jgi:hypothetical protein
VIYLEHRNRALLEVAVVIEAHLALHCLEQVVGRMRRVVSASRKLSARPSKSQNIAPTAPAAAPITGPSRASATKLLWPASASTMGSGSGGIEYRHGWNLPHSVCNRWAALLWANLAAILLGLSRLASAVANFAI